MIIPWGTDAPIYHWPKATVGLIAINVAAFIATVGLENEAREAWMLSRGSGLHPVEWLTANFMHAGLGHLIGNMIFLWSFGIVVEGKLGWPRFLPIYLIIAVIHGALVQAISLGASGGHVLGASAVIYALLAMCLIWAPRNDLHCIAFFRFNVSELDIPILLFATIYLAIEVLMVLLSRMAMSSAFLHVTGALIGLVFGLVMLKMEWVDCENWDLFAVMQRREGRSKSEDETLRQKARAPRPSPGAKKTAKARTEPKGETSFAEKAAAARERLKRHLDLGEAHAALSIYDKSIRTLPGWCPDEREWRELIKALVAAKAWPEAVNVMEDYLRRSLDPSAKVRITLAQVLILEQQRPAHALRLLAEVPEGALPESLEKTRRQLVRRAEQMREDGVLELEGEAW